MDKITLLGGFAINDIPLNCLVKFGVSIQFININLFSAELSLEDMAACVLAKLKAEDNNILMGYSCGGLIALKATLLRPDLIHRLVLINSSPKFIADKGWNGIDQTDFLSLVNKLHKLELDDFLHHFIALAMYPQRINGVRKFISLVQKSSLANLLTILQISDFRADMYSLGNQVFSIYSQHDILVPPNILPTPNVILTDSTHLKLCETQLLRVLDNICSTI